MIDGILGIKLDQSQTFDEKGNRIPVTVFQTGPCSVVQVKTKEKDGYDSLKLGISQKRIANKPQAEEFKKIALKNIPQHLKEVRLNEPADKKAGDFLALSEVFKEGDKIEVIGTAKGKGYAGAVKRHHFKGGPKSHGQSDRERAPGSIGSTTTPGRVYKGKRMAGRMGGEQKTVKNLQVVKIDAENNLLTIKGLVPGPRNGVLIIRKM